MTTFGVILDEKKRQAEEARRREQEDEDEIIEASARRQIRVPANLANKRKMRVGLSYQDRRARAKFIRDMLVNGARNADIVRACKQEFGAQVSGADIAKMRAGTYTGIGHEVFAKGGKPAADVPPKASASQVQEVHVLRDQFQKCLKIMRKQGVVYARLDANKGEAQIDIKATQTLSL